MRKLCFAMLCFIILSSCQKEARPGDITPVAPGTKLVRIGTRFGADSVTVDYGYNGANALTSLLSYGTVNGQSFNEQIVFKRSASNIITYYVYKADYFPQLGIDSIQADITYDAAAARYKTLVSRYTESGTVKRDSAIFNYDASGKLASYISYHNEGMGYLTDYKDSFSYAGNNLAFEKEYTYANGAFSLDQTTTYDQYDTKVNPSAMPADAPILGMGDFYSANNILKKTITDHTTGNTGTGTISYTYDATNRPVKSVGMNGTTTSTNTYYYQ